MSLNFDDLLTEKKQVTTVLDLFPASSFTRHEFETNKARVPEYKLRPEPVSIYYYLDYLLLLFIIYFITENSIFNLTKFNRIWIMITLFPLIWHQINRKSVTTIQIRSNPNPNFETDLSVFMQTMSTTGELDLKR